jgi:hypothetical protein
VWVSRIDGGLLVLGPTLATALSTGINGPLRDCLFVVAKLIKYGRVLDEHRLEKDGVWHGT